MKIAVIGAGISGLTAALELEKSFSDITIFEKSDSVGGRIKTDDYNGIPLDHGFQVLLTQYPAANEYLDFEKLNLKNFLPGSYIYKNGKRYRIGDLLRDSSFTLSSMMAPIGSFADKRNILKLSFEVKEMSLDEIFSIEEQTTFEYLKGYGFSPKIIDHFFRPFFSGIFLETELETSCRKFLFVYKMFAEGLAAVPNNGMQEISKQLASKLSKTSIQLNTGAKSTQDGIVFLENGGEQQFDFVISANSIEQDTLEWNACSCLYFQVPKSTFKHTLIALVANKNALINNLHFVTDVLDTSAEKGVLSVTVVKKHELNEQQLIDRVKKELAKECRINEADFIKHYRINRALPTNKTVSYAPKTDDIWLDSKTVVSGDYLANGSLNAAMLSGKVAAEAIKLKCV